MITFNGGGGESLMICSDCDMKFIHVVYIKAIQTKDENRLRILKKEKSCNEITRLIILYVQSMS